MSRDGNLIVDMFGKPAELSPEEEGIVALEHSMALEKKVGARPGNTMSYSEKAALVKAIQELEARQEKGGHLKHFFLSDGPFKYDKYAKHLEFFKSGADYRERIFMAANRVGKTVAGGFEMACHMTGQYPPWWEGRRFFEPVDCWCAGDTGQTTRDIIQATMVGQTGALGTGLIEEALIESIRMRPGIPDAIDTIKVRHTTGGISTLGFKSYDQKRRSFQGTARHVIWLDEEPPDDVYNECLIRTMTTRGVVYVTFTPLQGLTRFVSDFMAEAHKDINFD